MKYIHLVLFSLLFHIDSVVAQPDPPKFLDAKNVSRSSFIADWELVGDIFFMV